MIHSVINHCVILSFVGLFDRPEFKRKFQAPELLVKDFSIWVGKAAVFAVKAVMSKMEQQVSRMKSGMK